MARFFGQTIVFGSLTVPIALATAMPQAAAVEEMRQFNDDSKKASTTKSCPEGREIQREEARLRQNELRYGGDLEQRCRRLRRLQLCFSDR
jgi:hypothetical protein